MKRIEGERLSPEVKKEVSPKKEIAIEVKKEVAKLPEDTVELSVEAKIKQAKVLSESYVETIKSKEAGKSVEAVGLEAARGMLPMFKQMGIKIKLDSLAKMTKTEIGILVQTKQNEKLELYKRESEKLTSLANEEVLSESSHNFAEQVKLEAEYLTADIERKEFMKQMEEQAAQHSKESLERDLAKLKLQESEEIKKKVEINSIEETSEILDEEMIEQIQQVPERVRNAMIRLMQAKFNEGIESIQEQTRANDLEQRLANMVTTETQTDSFEEAINRHFAELPLQHVEEPKMVEVEEREEVVERKMEEKPVELGFEEEMLDKNAISQRIEHVAKILTSEINAIEYQVIPQQTKKYIEFFKKGLSNVPKEVIKNVLDSHEINDNSQKVSNVTFNKQKQAFLAQITVGDMQQSRSLRVKVASNRWAVYDSIGYRSYRDLGSESAPKTVLESNKYPSNKIRVF